ncbi:hypothetical protein [Streptomyces sp. SID12501]|uniref:Uncharacterized protein n=1 Tax=Streptomyces sp. SID12501 TaxID=2706042 RepID=A0A6B3BH06_9ACTN|nr:hypothetical protein [Streptomyces sp. SID12501]NEC85040.1 hypothetical protein [Streptomyces sp. SID12501]
MKPSAIAAYRRAVNEACAAVDELPGLDSVQRRTFRKSVRRNVCFARAPYQYFVHRRMRLIFFSTLTLACFLAFLAQVWFENSNSRTDSSGLIVGGLSGLLIFTILVPRVIRRIRGKRRRSSVARIFMFLNLVAYISSVVVYPLVGAAWPTFVTGAAAFPLAFLLSGFAILSIYRKAVGPRLVRPDCTHIAAALAMLDAAALVSRSQSKWHYPQVSRDVVMELEYLARTVQSELSLTHRIGRWHPDLFSQTSVEALKVAHVVRQHKKVIVCASSASDFEKVALSLTSGTQALLVNDRSKLLEGAPDVVRKERIKIAIKHVFPVVLLIAAAIILPLVPPISGQDKIADSIRLTLIVAAVLALVAPRSDSSARILDTLGKAMPSK